MIYGFETELRSANANSGDNAVAGGKVYLAIQYGCVNVIARSEVASIAADAPRWLKVCERVYKESGLPLDPPEWTGRYKDSEKYLNVCFE